jgi:hypothetical protein
MQLIPQQTNLMTPRRGLLMIGALLAGVAAWGTLTLVDRSHREEPYSLIEDRLYLGRAVREPPPGITAVVNLCGHEDPYRAESCLWEPVFEGGKEPDLDWLRRVVEFIEKERRAGRTVFVHCLAGVNRSATATVAYLMREHSWDRDRALAFVRSKRPQVQPNPTMMELLAEFEAGGNR